MTDQPTPGHEFKHAGAYRGDNVELCGVCMLPESTHKFSQTTKLQPTRSSLREQIERTITKLAANSADLGRRDLDDGDVRLYAMEQGAIDAIMQLVAADRQRLVDEILAGLPEKRPLVPYGSVEFDSVKDARNSGYNNAITECRQAVQHCLGDKG